MIFFLYYENIFSNGLTSFEVCKLIDTIYKCTNAVALFDKGPENHCEDQQFNFTNPGLIVADPNDTLIFVLSTDPDRDIAAGGSFIKILSSKTVFFDGIYMSYNTQYYIFVLLGPRDGKGSIDFRKPCVQSDGPKPFEFYQNPSPNAGVDDAICDFQYKLNGIQSIIGSSLQWRFISGVTQCFIADASSSSTFISSNSHGTYVFELTEENHGCIASDQVSITFNSSPFISVDQKICIDQNDKTYPYQAIIKITNGLPPYTLLQGNGIITSNSYITDTIPSLTNFTVEIHDANSCVSNLVIDTYNCNCGSINWGMPDSTAGRDSKQKGLYATLNATHIDNAIWKQISGPGKAIFENAINPKSKVRTDVYGTYCFEWSIKNDPCSFKDTVCIEFYKLKIIDPKSPHVLIEDRSKFSDEEQYSLMDVFTPNLISNSGVSFIEIDGELNSQINYTWCDNIGRIILKDKILIEQGMSRLNINSPVYGGLYFLVFEINGVSSVRKICVIQ